MAAARIANRLGRQGRANPGRRHLAGADVTARMQRQYEDILQSLRHYRRYATDAKRKQVAAATVRKMQNPGAGEEQSRAEMLAEEFHGRPVRDVIDVEEPEVYDEHAVVLGILIDLKILMEDGNSFIPIRFARESPRVDEDTVYVTSNPAGSNIEFIGGDQDIDWHSVDGAAQEDKYLVWVGPVYSIAYYTDKHHLTGPKSQKYGTPYDHKFGEEDEDGEPRELPCLIFDRQNRKMLLVGGDYTITPEGIEG